jgi:hypothetical protein
MHRLFNETCSGIGRAKRRRRRRSRPGGVSSALAKRLKKNVNFFIDERAAVLGS